jgi:hypothetical protein
MKLIDWATSPSNASVAAPMASPVAPSTRLKPDLAQAPWIEPERPAAKKLATRKDAAATPSAILAARRRLDRSQRIFPHPSVPQDHFTAKTANSTMSKEVFDEIARHWQQLGYTAVVERPVP